MPRSGPFPDLLNVCGRIPGARDGEDSSVSEWGRGGASLFFAGWPGCQGGGALEQGLRREERRGEETKKGGPAGVKPDFGRKRQEGAL
mmetsp:Transcript_5236/g.10371  ORF Transcript_5236/g.10371 Transcript_5236/m.10371 type:complete len:88 (+) Transcript_5236:629-892(+)